MDFREDRTRRTVAVPAATGHGQGMSLSPDSRWLAFGGWVAGRKEVFVQRFPDGTRTTQVSIGGGDFPLWSRDGREVLYRRGEAVLAARIRVAGDEIFAERPRELFRGDFVTKQEPHLWSYDRATDTMILIRRGDHEISDDRLVVILDWLAGPG